VAVPAQWRSQVISRLEYLPAISRSPGCTFSSKSFFSCRPQNTGRQRRFTVKIKQIKRSDMVTFLFSCSHYYWGKAIRTARQGKARAWARAVDLPARSFDLVRPGIAPPLTVSFLLDCLHYVPFSGFGSSVIHKEPRQYLDEIKERCACTGPFSVTRPDPPVTSKILTRPDQLMMAPKTDIQY